MADDKASALINLSGAANALAGIDEEDQRREREAHKIAHDLLFNQGLYAAVDVTTPVGAKVLHRMRSAGFSFDAYCMKCKRETPFRVGWQAIPTRGLGSATKASPPQLFSITAACQRDWTTYSYVLLIEDAKLIKIGQFPSIADLAFGELRTIDKSLDPTDRRELGKALGLFAHDSALGAFAYLRRVFERMIERAHDRQSQAGHPVEGFADMRMDEKIATLKDELPDAVVRNSGVFSVLSIGLHELTEEQCAKHFPVIKAVLFQMLEQEEHKRKAAITQRDTEAALQRILSDPTGTEGQ